MLFNIFMFNESQVSQCYLGYQMVCPLVSKIFIVDDLCIQKCNVSMHVNLFQLEACGRTQQKTKRVVYFNMVKVCPSSLNASLCSHIHMYNTHPHPHTYRKKYFSDDFLKNYLQSSPKNTLSITLFGNQTVHINLHIL